MIIFRISNPLEKQIEFPLYGFGKTHPIFEDKDVSIEASHGYTICTTVDDKSEQEFSNLITQNPLKMWRLIPLVAPAPAPAMPKLQIRIGIHYLDVTKETPKTKIICAEKEIEYSSMISKHQLQTCILDLTQEYDHSDELILRKAGLQTIKEELHKRAPKLSIKTNEKYLRVLLFTFLVESTQTGFKNTYPQSIQNLMKYADQI